MFRVWNRGGFRRPLALGILGMLVLGCSESSPRPHIDSVEPDQIPRGAETTVRVHGVNFFNSPEVLVDSRKDAEVNRLWTVLLDDTPVVSVTWIDTGTLDVVVPATLIVGAYDVTVISPDGTPASLRDGLAVVDGGLQYPDLDPPDDPGQPAGLTCTTGAPVLMVTTPDDELDAGETPQAPHQGAGLSFREALTLANEPGEHCIQFASTMTLTPASTYPAITDHYTDIEGGGTTIDADALPGGSPLLAVAAYYTRLADLTVQDFGMTSGSVGIQVQATAAYALLESIVVRNGFVGLRDGGNLTRIHELEIYDCDTGVRLEGSRALVEGAFIRDTLGDGLNLGGDRNELRLSVVTGAGGPALRLSGDAHTVWHNTLVESDRGVQVTGSAGDVAFYNNIVIENSGRAIQGGTSGFAGLDYNLFFNNGSGICNNCSLPTANDVTADPMIADLRSMDAATDPGSPAVDSALDVGLDVNGSDPGLFNGAGPDIGAYEAPVP